jgi:hypothetical protein
MQMYVKDLLARLIEKDSFELRVLYQTSCQRLFTGNAGENVPPVIMAEKVKSWTTFFCRIHLMEIDHSMYYRLKLFVKLIDYKIYWLAICPIPAPRSPN